MATDSPTDEQNWIHKTIRQSLDPIIVNSEHITVSSGVYFADFEHISVWELRLLKNENASKPISVQCCITYGNKITYVQIKQLANNTKWQMTWNATVGWDGLKAFKTHFATIVRWLGQYSGTWFLSGKHAFVHAFDNQLKWTIISYSTGELTLRLIFLIMTTS